MTDNGLPGTADLWQAGIAGAAAAPARPAIAGGAATLLISMAGFEVFKQLSGIIPADVDGAVVLVDPDRLTVRTERVLAHPAVSHDERARPRCPTAPRTRTNGLIAGSTGWWPTRSGRCAGSTTTPCRRSR
jgi:hypothetical protein